MKYTVAVCTWNRSALLEDCIMSIATQSEAPDHEILVLDNASTDGTAELVATLVERVPGLRRVFEPRLGLSHARNRVLREADGDVVAFLDDDARADAGWLRSLDERFTLSGSAECVGGPIRLEWQRTPPSWFPPIGSLYFGELDLSKEARPLARHERPRGANFAVRRSTAQSLGGFRADLGRAGRSLLSGEDDDFLNRLQQAGLEVWWEPGASVSHLVTAERASLRWLLRRAWMQGRSEVRIERGADRGTLHECWRAARTDAKRAARHAVQLWVRRARHQRRWANEGVFVAQAAGRTYGETAAMFRRRYRAQT
jgi:GT2 family glycosyltransferase